MRSWMIGAAIACAACSGGGGKAGGSVVGTIRGNDYLVVDAASAIVAANGRAVATILMTSTPNTCADYGALVVHGGEQQVQILVEGSQTGMVVAGDYSIAAGGSSAEWNATTLDTACTVVDSVTATSGTVTISEANGIAFSGSYDVFLNSGDHVTGYFVTGACQALEQQTVQPPTCQ